MPLSRPISRSLAAISFAQSCAPFLICQPKPAASSAQPPYSPACTSSFFGTQPTLTQVPPQKRSSATPTRAPWPAAMRPQRTPAEPPPITNRSKSIGRNLTLECAGVWDASRAIARLGRTVDVAQISQPLTEYHGRKLGDHVSIEG